MNPLEPLFWMGCIYFLFLAINRQQPKLLLWCGVLLGFGLENKHSTVFFLSALVVGLLATLERRPLTSKWFWIAAAIAFAIAFRMLPGNITSLPCARRPAQCKNDSQERRILPPLPFIGQQIRVLAPVSALV
jgi:hypothetical protein